MSLRAAGHERQGWWLHTNRPGTSAGGPKYRVPHYTGCKLPEVDTIDPHEGSMTMVVLDDFRHETR